MIISILYLVARFHTQRTELVSLEELQGAQLIPTTENFRCVYFEFYRIVLIICEGLRIWMFSNSIIHSICFSTVPAKHFYCSKTFSTICTSKYTFGILLIVVHIVLKLHTPSNKNSLQHIIENYIIKCLCNIIFDIKSMCMCVCFVLIYNL